ncbi:MAG: hypothetical protein MSA56_08030 [Clostridium sp.]|nr:hypothetical protein [Clostridium sp.]
MSNSIIDSLDTLYKEGVLTLEDILKLLNVPTATKVNNTSAKEACTVDDTVQAEYKKCVKCGQVLPVEEFSKDNKRKDRLQSWCKGCQKEYRDQHKQKNTNQKNNNTDVSLVESSWKKVIEKIKDDRKLSIAALLREVSSFNVKDNILYLIFNDNFSFARTRLNSQDTIKYVESVIREVTNRSFNIQIYLESEVANLHKQEEINTKQRRFKWQL